MAASLHVFVFPYRCPVGFTNLFQSIFKSKLCSEKNRFQNQKKEMKCCSDKRVHTKSEVLEKWSVDISVFVFLLFFLSRVFQFLLFLMTYIASSNTACARVLLFLLLSFPLPSFVTFCFSHPRIEVCKTAGMAYITFLGFAYLNAVKKMQMRRVREGEGFLLKLVFSLYGAGMGFSWIMLRPAGFPYTSQISGERVIWIYIAEVFEVLQLLFCNIVRVR